MQGIFFSSSSSSEFKGLYFSHYNDDCLSLMNFTEVRISLLLVIPPSMWNFNKGGRRALRFMIFGRKTDLNCKWFWHINIHNMRLVLHVERKKCQRIFQVLRDQEKPCSNPNTLDIVCKGVRVFLRGYWSKWFEFEDEEG